MGYKYNNSVSSFEDKYPDIALLWDSKKNELLPSQVSYGSSKKVFWICLDYQHEFDSRISDMIRKTGKLCPYCSGRKFGYGNDFGSLYPELMKEWHFDKNSLDPYTTAPKSKKEVWWICLDEKHEFQMSIQQRVIENGKCVVCQSLGFRFPYLLKEWDFEKNELDPFVVKPYSTKMAFWKCLAEDHQYDMEISLKPTRKSGKPGYGCPYCSGKRIGYGNDLESMFPDIAKEWNFEKNIKHPNEISAYSHDKVFWLCQKRNHSYDASVKHRTLSKSGCPFCSGRKASPESNLLIEYPNVAKEWDYELNDLSPDKVNSGSQDIYWWKCPIGHLYPAKPNHRTSSNSGCPYCVLTPRSKEEVYLLFELKEFFNIDENNHKIKLDKIYDLDIIINEHKIIIEYDGAYWHKDKLEKDIKKTNKLFKSNWTVIRVREVPLEIIDEKYNIPANGKDYKNTVNKVLKKISQLGFEVDGIETYLKRKNLINKIEADKYISKLLKEKNK